MQNHTAGSSEADIAGNSNHSPDRSRFRGPPLPLSPSVPTTTTSTSSYPPPFPFQQTSSPTVSSQPPLTRAQRTDEARTAFTAALRSAGSYLDSELQARARDLHANAAALEKQDQDLREQTEAIREENDGLEEQIREQRQGLLDLNLQTRLEIEQQRLGPDGKSNASVEGEAEASNVNDLGALGITSLGDIGDLDQFLKGLEKDMLVLEETVRIVEEGTEPEAAQETITDEVHEAGEFEVRESLDQGPQIDHREMLKGKELEVEQHPDLRPPGSESTQVEGTRPVEHPTGIREHEATGTPESTAAT